MPTHHVTRVVARRHHRRRPDGPAVLVPPPTSRPQPLENHPNHGPQPRRPVLGSHPVAQEHWRRRALTPHERRRITLTSCDRLSASNANCSVRGTRSPGSMGGPRRLAGPSPSVSPSWTSPPGPRRKGCATRSCSVRRSASSWRPRSAVGPRHRRGVWRAGRDRRVGPHGCPPAGCSSGAGPSGTSVRPHSRRVPRLRDHPAPTLFDVVPWPDVAIPTVHRVIQGDRRCSSVAAASVVAKVTRDS